MIVVVVVVGVVVVDIHTELRSESRRRYQPTWENNIKMDNK
jgi:hypothetical protein